MSGVTGVARLEVAPVVFDCGCSVVPQVLNADTVGGEGKPHTTGAALVHCPDHGIRYDVEVAEVVVSVTYAARRLDPPDPEPEALAGVGPGPHVYTIARVLAGIPTAPCLVCGAGRNGSGHVADDENGGAIAEAYTDGES